MTRAASAMGEAIRGWARGGHRLVAAVAWIALVAGSMGWAVSQGIGPAEAAQQLVSALQGSSWGPVAFVAAYLARPLIFFSASVVTVAGGFLFGPVAGIALVLVAANGSAMVAYFLARWFGRRPLDGGGRWNSYAQRMLRHSFETVLVARLLFVPYDLVSYAAGAARINPVAFLAGTALGSAPTTVAFVLFGASLESFDGGVPSVNPTVLIASGALLAAALAAAHVLRRRRGVDHERS